MDGGTHAGYEITKRSNQTGLRFTTCKRGKNVTVTDGISGTDKTVTATTAAGSTTPARGICRTQAVPKEAPRFTSAHATQCAVGAACNFMITTAGRPATKVTTNAHLPAGMALTSGPGDTAYLQGKPRARTKGTYRLPLVAGNGVAPAARQTLTLTISP